MTTRTDEFTSNYQNLNEFIQEFLRKYADQPAFTCIGQTYTFKQVDLASDKLAHFYTHTLGLKQGDRIAIQLPNLIQYPIAMYAAIKTGLVVVNCNPMYTPREMSHQFKDSNAKALVVLSDLLPNYEAIKDQVEIEHVIVTSATDLLTNEVTQHDKGYYDFNQILRSDKVDYPVTTATHNDLCVLQYTGGTTGVSKGAMLTHRSIMSNVFQFKSSVAAFNEKQEIMVCPLPLYHIYAFVIGMLMQPCAGNQVILIPNPRDLDGFVKQISAFKLTVFAGINTLFVGLGNHPGFRSLDFSSLRVTISGGTTLTSAASKLWHDVTGCEVMEAYGLSETSPAITADDPNNITLGTVGYPITDTEVELWDDNDQPVPDGERGQLVSRGPQNMAGYWNMPEETAQVMKNGFFKTGDIAVRLPDGKIKIVDRLKDMIIVSGFNVFPNEIEDILVQHPNVIEAAVIGKNDDKTGERICAYVTVSNAIDENEVRDFCRQHLTAYKIPKEVITMDALPKSSVGKILRKELRTE